MSRTQGNGNRIGSTPDWTLLSLDVIGILALPIVLLGVRFLASPTVHSLLTYTSTDPTLHGLFGHWAVHYSPLLLLENAVGYLVVAIVGYLLAWRIDERRWYRLSLLSIVLVVPALGAILSTRAYGTLLPGFEYTARGASAIVAATLGLAYVLCLGGVRRTYDLRATISIGGSMLIAVLVILLVRVGTPAVELVAGLGAAGAVVVLFDAGERLANDAGTTVRFRNLLRTGVTTGAVTIVLAAYFLALFPANPFAGQFVTNVVSHALGFGLGTVIAWWGHRYWTSVDWIGSSRI